MENRKIIRNSHTKLKRTQPLLVNNKLQDIQKLGGFIQPPFPF